MSLFASLSLSLALSLSLSLLANVDLLLSRFLRFKLAKRRFYRGKGKEEREKIRITGKFVKHLLTK